jgi:hypothetical protein
MENENVSLLICAAIILIVIIIFVRIAIRVRKYGGSLTTRMFGTTYEFLNADRKKAVEEIIEKKSDEEHSGEPENK